MAELSDRSPTEPLAPSLVRLESNEQLLGSGFVLPGDLVATCAHVVADFCAVTASFPLWEGKRSTAEVIERDDERDVAVLRLTHPPQGIQPAPVRLDTDIIDDPFRSVGFTATHPDGVWTTGKLVGIQGQGRIQVVVDRGEPVTDGCSGGPVWDKRLGGVVGMVVTRTGKGDTTAHLVSIADIGGESRKGRNPYLGLDTFQTSDSGFFYGRDSEIDELESLILHQDMVAIAGPSGSGKSSLVRAGLIPRLEKRGATIVELNEGTCPDSLEDGSVLFLDQFEEEVITNPISARERLEDLIRIVANRDRKPGQPAPLRIILTLRSKSLDDLITTETRKELNQAVWLLEPMDRAKFRTVITQPALQAGALSFEEGLVERILDDAPPGHGTLPLLSNVLSQLWTEPTARWLSHAAYEKTGRLAGSLNEHANAVLKAERPSGEETVRRLFRQLVRTDDEGNFVRQSVPLAELDSNLEALARKLSAPEYRLVVIREDRVSVVHQVLIDHWLRLREWLEEDRKLLAWQEKLHNLERSGGELTGGLLAEASEWLHDRPDEIPAHTREFISHSQSVHDRNQRRWRRVTAASTILAILASLFAVVAIRYYTATNNTLRATNSTLIAEASSQNTSHDPQAALQLALASFREDPDNADAYGALLEQRLNWDGADRILPPQLVGQPEGSTASADGRVMAFNQSTPGRITVLQDQFSFEPKYREIATAFNTMIELSPDGQKLMGFDRSGNLAVWNLNLPDNRPILQTSIPYQAVYFSADSRYIAAEPRPPAGSVIKIWDLTSMLEVPSQAAVRSPISLSSEGGTSASLMGPTGPFPINGAQELIMIEDRDPRPDKSAILTAVRDRRTGLEVRTYPGNMILGNGTHVGICSNGTLSIVNTVTNSVGRTLPGFACAGKPDLTGQYLQGSSGAVQWRTGQFFNWKQPVFTRPISTSASTAILTDPKRGLISTQVVGGVVRTLAVTPDIPSDLNNSISDGYASEKAQKSSDGWWIDYDEGQNYEDGVGDLQLTDPHGETKVQHLVPRPESLGFGKDSDRVLLFGKGSMRILNRDLSLIDDVTLPSLPNGEVPNDAPPTSLVTPKTGEVLVSHYGLVSYWDVTTGEQTSPPIALKEDVTQSLHPYSSRAHLTVRPGHPDQFIALTGDKLSVWNYATRERIKEIVVGGVDSYIATSPDISPITVSADGSKAAIKTGRSGNLSSSDSVRVIDLESGYASPEFNAGTGSLAGISGDRLFIETGSTGHLTLDVWDWKSRRKLSKDVESSDSNSYSSLASQVRVIGNHLVFEGVGHRSTIPLDANSWFHDLCRASDREFTQAEKNLLPSGAPHNQPCQ